MSVAATSRRWDSSNGGSFTNTDSGPAGPGGVSSASRMRPVVPECWSSTVDRVTSAPGTDPPRAAVIHAGVISSADSGNGRRLLIGDDRRRRVPRWPTTRDPCSTSSSTAIQRGDIEAVAPLYADDVEVWHNVTGRAIDKAASLDLLRFWSGQVSEMRYEVVERSCYEGGAVQRHVIHGRAGGEVLACIDLHRVPRRRRARSRGSTSTSTRPRSRPCSSRPAGSAGSS